MFESLQYLDDYEDAWNLLGTCVKSRMTFLKMLKREVESVPSMSEEERRGWYWGPGMTLEEAREGLAGEIGEVIGWLEDRKGSGVFQDPTLDQRLGLHHMHAVRRGFIIDWANIPYSESHPEVFQRPQPVMTTPTTFHQFPLLPQELQSHIWSLASLSHAEYKWSEHAIDINVSFLRTISDLQLQHYEPIDVCPSFPRRIPQSLPSLYTCMYGELQYLDGYQDTWNLLGACVESRRSMLKMLRKVMCEIEAPEKDLNEERWFSFEQTTVEEVKTCLVREIGEVIGWLDGEKRGNGYVHSELIYRINWNVPYMRWKLSSTRQ